MEVSKEVYMTQSDWEPLNMKWRIKLNSENFMIKNTLEENTLVSAIINSGILKTRGKVMNMIAKYIKDIPQGEFVDLIENYRISSDNKVYIGDWDPYNIHNKRDFTKQIKMLGFKLHGDNVTLCLLSRVLKVDFIIFGSDYSIEELYNGNDRMIMIYYDKERSNYRVMGVRGVGGRVNMKIDVLINKIKMSKELIGVLDKNEFYLGHIKNICEEKVCKKMVLPELVGELENRMQIKLDVEDRKKVISMIRGWLQDEMYFKKGRMQLKSSNMNIE